MLLHCGFPGAEAGWLGVDLFLVLSGFLITTLLLDERRRTGRVRLDLFLARRAVRLLPVYLLYTSAMTAVMLAAPPAEFQHHDGWSPVGYVLSLWGFFANFAPLDGIWARQYLTAHLWSLSLEAQFYIVWPLSLVALNARWLLPVTWSIVVAACAWSLVEADAQSAMLLPNRGIGLFIGGAVAVTNQRAPTTLATLRLLSPTACWLAMLAAIAAYAAMRYLTASHAAPPHLLLRGWIPAFDLAVALAVVNLWRAPYSCAARWLSFAPLAWIGRVSYGVYVFHMIAWSLVFAGREWGDRKLLVAVPLYLTAALALAAVSDLSFERRFVGWRRRLQPD